MKSFYVIIALAFLYSSLQAQDSKDSIYFAKMSALGTRIIPVYKGKYKVFTQKHGAGKMQLLLLHGGPENTHEYFENFPEHLAGSGVTMYYYDQLGSYFSDTPDDSTIWNIDRFVEEVEEVRKGLGIDTFYLLGHSWGGMLAELYAAKYGQHLKGLILSNVPGFITTDTNYLDAIIDSIDGVARYQATLLSKFKEHYAQVDSISRGLMLTDSTMHKALAFQYNKAADSLFGRTMYYHKEGPIPESLKRNFRHCRFESIEKYNFNPIGADYKQALKQIHTPTLLLGGGNDFLNPEKYGELKKMMTKTRVRVAVCPNGAHFTMWDDTECYFSELNRFLREVNEGSFNPDK